ncbi:MAG: N-acetyl-gamma-glutamyl-phosphate reductase [Candidatus Melainabacteria bacterium]|nr:N-acetyl-gamma-glutamyl-phosphate reductase [Candidatus Melainabacteria bacterium]
MIKVGIVGATGYTGQELVRLLLPHPDARIECLTSNSYKGKKFSSVFPAFDRLVDLELMSTDDLDEILERCDFVFFALPHGIAAELLKTRPLAEARIVDLGADFRLRNARDYQSWYQLEHPWPEALSKSVYGLSEWRRDRIREASIVANPGCYATSVELALIPLAEAGLLGDDTIVDAKSGVSGAGRSASVDTHFNECNESIKAYKVAAHRHTPEIEQELGSFAGQQKRITFTPHLIPIQRGILSTIYCNLPEGVGIDEIRCLYRESYASEPFVRVLENRQSPETRWVAGTNYCDLSINIDERTERLIIISALDNLIKGAAGQAIQNMNIMSNFDETKGLSLLPRFP